MKKNIFTALLTFLLLHGNLFGQKEYGLDKFIFEASVSKIKKKVDKKARLKPMSPFLKKDIVAHRITYKTEYLGKEIEVSGSILLPSEINEPLPVYIFCHGTTFNTENAPSLWQNGMRLEALPAYNGFISFYPDYIGYGYSANNVLPPYLDQEVTVNTILDGIRALEAALIEEQIPYLDDFFLFGFSQGGSAALAIRRALDLNPDSTIRINMIFASGGPYKLKDVCTELLSQTKYHATPYFAYLFGVWNKNYWNRPYTDFFQKKYAETVRRFAEGEITLKKLVKSMPNSNEKLLSPDFIEAFLNEGENQVKQTFDDHSQYNWTSKNKIIIYHGTDDNLVFFDQAKEIYEQLLELGAHSDNLSFVPIIDKGGHNMSGYYSILESLKYVNSLLADSN